MRRLDTLLAAGTAWAGLVLGHGLTYLLAYPAASERQVHLTATGHAWLGPAVLSLGAAIPAVLVATAVRAARSRTAALGGLLPVLAVAQAGAFLAVEVAERGLDVGGALADPAVVLGLVVQVAVATAAWFVLASVTTVVAAVSARPTRHPRARPRAPRPAASRIPAPRSAFLVRARRRAPPAPLPA